MEMFDDILNLWCCLNYTLKWSVMAKIENCTLEENKTSIKSSADKQSKESTGGVFNGADADALFSDGDCEVACRGGEPPHDHPLVYLRVGEDGITCPYCSQKFPMRRP